MESHHDHGNSYNGKHLSGWFTISEVQPIIVMVGHGSIQADKVLELRVLHLDRQATGSKLRY